MADTTNYTNDPDEASRRALRTHVGDDIDDLVDPQIALTAVHVPGTPLERREDAESSRAYAEELAEIAVDTIGALDIPEYDGIDTRTPDANYETRSNIVRP